MSTIDKPTLLETMLTYIKVNGFGVNGKAVWHVSTQPLVDLGFSDAQIKDLARKSGFRKLKNFRLSITTADIRPFVKSLVDCIG